MNTQNTAEEEKKSLTISELAHLHLNDHTHTTTDEELRNATVELTSSEDVEVDEQNLFEVDNTTVIPPMDFEKEEDENENDKNSHTPGVPNPYDVLR